MAWTPWGGKTWTDLNTPSIFKSAPNISNGKTTFDHQIKSTANIKHLASESSI